MTGVNNGRASAHAQPVQSRDHGLKLLTAVDRQKTHDVFKNNDLGQTTIRLQVPHEIDEGPKCPGSRPVGAGRLADSKTVARCREILTGE